MVGGGRLVVGGLREWADQGCLCVVWALFPLHSHSLC